MARIKIFTATYHRFEFTKNSLLSLKESIERTKNHEIELFIGDNNSPVEMKSWILQTFAGQPGYNLFMAEKNIGKPAIINHMWSKSDKDCDVVCSFDSDLIAIEENMDWIDRCVKCLEAPNVGLVSTEQTVQCCHLKGKLDQRMEYEGNKLLYGRYWGVAGGCIFMKKSIWEKIGGYKIYGLYGGDDASVMDNIGNKMKKLCVVNESAPLIHPNDLDKGYIKWKQEACGKIRAVKRLDSKGYYDE